MAGRIGIYRAASAEVGQANRSQLQGQLIRGSAGFRVEIQVHLLGKGRVGPAWRRRRCVLEGEIRRAPIGPASHHPARVVL